MYVDYIFHKEPSAYYAASVRARARAIAYRPTDLHLPVVLVRSLVLLDERGERDAPRASRLAPERGVDLAELAVAARVHQREDSRLERRRRRRPDARRRRR